MGLHNTRYNTWGTVRVEDLYFEYIKQYKRNEIKYLSKYSRNIWRLNKEIEKLDTGNKYDYLNIFYVLKRKFGAKASPNPTSSAYNIAKLIFGSRTKLDVMPGVANIYVIQTNQSHSVKNWIDQKFKRHKPAKPIFRFFTSTTNPQIKAFVSINRNYHGQDIRGVEASDHYKIIRLFQSMFDQSTSKNMEDVNFWVGFVGIALLITPATALLGATMITLSSATGVGIDIGQVFHGEETIKSAGISFLFYSFGGPTGKYFLKTYGKLLYKGIPTPHFKRITAHHERLLAIWGKGLDVPKDFMMKELKKNINKDLEKSYSNQTLFKP